jgi:hypothetical protein
MYSLKFELANLTVVKLKQNLVQVIFANETAIYLSTFIVYEIENIVTIVSTNNILT